MDLKVFGKKLRELRRKIGFGQEKLVSELVVAHARFQPERELRIDSNLISKWERAYKDKTGRGWTPNRLHVICLVEIFASQFSSSEAKEWALQAGYKLSDAELARIFLLPLACLPVQAPPIPDFYVKREQLEEEISQKLQNEETQTLVLWGQGGTGKTTLATWVATALKEKFPDGVIWIESYPNDKIEKIQDWIAYSFGFALRGKDLAKRTKELRSRLCRKQCLIIVDNIWYLPYLDTLRLGSEANRLLLTTQDKKVADVLNAPLIPITGLTDEEGLKLLANWVGHEIEGQELVTRLKGLVLALNLSGAQLRDGILLDDLLGHLRKEQTKVSFLDMSDPKSREESLTICFDLSYHHLSPLEQQCFAQLGCFVRSNFEEAETTTIWGIDLDECRLILKQLVRFAFLERTGNSYRLHPLLHNYARQKLVKKYVNINEESYRRHAEWHIRYALYHPHLLSQSTVAPNLEQTWMDILAGVKWAIAHQPNLAAWAALLAHTERAALLEEIGLPLINAVTIYLAKIDDKTEQVLFHELLGDLYLLSGDIDAGLVHFEQASQLWHLLGNDLASSRAKLRVAGAYLVQQNQAAAAESARQAQAILAQSLPIADDNIAIANQLFYWFDMIYNPLVRWEGLPESDVESLASLAKQTNQPLLEARGIHIHRMWCTTKEVPHSEEIRQKGRDLALEAYKLWRAYKRIDRADDEISWSIYLLTGRYSRRAATRFAKRRSSSSPAMSLAQIHSIKSQATRWWLSATGEQRIKWLSWMLPRYLAVKNCPAHPHHRTHLPALPPNSRAWSWVNDILNIGMLGHANRYLAKNNPPADHLLNGPEWYVLSGQKALLMREQTTKSLIENYLATMEHELQLPEGDHS